MSDTAKIFMTGRSQAVRLPKALRFEGKEVLAKRFGNGVLLLPIEDSYAMLREAVGEFEPGFRLERAQPDPQSRVDWAP
jgi:antitoxin VapB